MTSDAALARLGFIELDRAQRIIAAESFAVFMADGEAQQHVLEGLGASADPDQALLLFGRILEACDHPARRRMGSALLADEDLRGRLFDVLGMSEALGEFLVRHPGKWEILVDAEALSVAPSATGTRRDLLLAV